MRANVYASASRPAAASVWLVVVVYVPLLQVAEHSASTARALAEVAPPKVAAEFVRAQAPADVRLLEAPGAVRFESVVELA